MPRRRRKIVAALKLLGPESVDQLETEIEERGVLIQKARHDACIAENVSSYISLLVGASLHVHVSNTCFILHAAYFILHVHVYT